MLLRQSTATTVDPAQRAEAMRELDRVREPIVELLKELRLLYNEMDNLEWSIWATDPEGERHNFNQEYADRRFTQDLPVFRERLARVVEILGESWG